MVSSSSHPCIHSPSSIDRSIDRLVWFGFGLVWFGLVLKPNGSVSGSIDASIDRVIDDE